MRDEKALTRDQFNNLMDMIEGQYSFGKYGHTIGVKYIDPHFDMRDGKCFYIKLRYSGGEVEFDSRCSTISMFNDILEWFNKAATEMEERC